MKTLEQIRQMFSQPPEPIHEAITEAPETESKAGVVEVNIQMDDFDRAEHYLRHAGKRSLKGKSIAFTGKLSRPRVRFQALIREAGGEVNNRVDKWTNLLVVGSSRPGKDESMKFKKAREYNVERCSESDLIALITGE